MKFWHRPPAQSAHRPVSMMPRDGVAQLRRELPGVDFFYSLKANPNLSIVQLLAGQDIGAEVCSLFGIETCLAAGVRPERMIVVGPAKSDEDRAGRRQRIGLRISPAFHIPGACLAMGGKPTQFGIDEAELAAAIADVAGDRRPPTADRRPPTTDHRPLHARLHGSWRCFCCPAGRWPGHRCANHRHRAAQQSCVSLWP